MIYHDDFYNLSNLVGKTETLGQLPTFYFEKHVDSCIQFGHITQAHTNSDNIGRNLIMSHRDYTKQLNPDDNTLQECIRGHVFRESCNGFQTIDPKICSNAQRTEVLQTLINFPYIKNSQAIEAQEAKQVGRDLTRAGSLVWAARIFEVQSQKQHKKYLHNNFIQNQIGIKVI